MWRTCNENIDDQRACGKGIKPWGNSWIVEEGIMLGCGLNPCHHDPGDFVRFQHTVSVGRLGYIPIVMSHSATGRTMICQRLLYTVWHRDICGAQMMRAR